jgi:hypothetical protein
LTAAHRTHGAGVEAFARAFHSLFNFPDTTKKISFAGRTDISLVKEYFRLNHYTPSQRDIEDFFPCYISWLGRLIKQSDGAICPGVKELFMPRKNPSIRLSRLLTGNIRSVLKQIKNFGHWDDSSSALLRMTPKIEIRLRTCLYKSQPILNNKLQRKRLW